MPDKRRERYFLAALREAITDVPAGVPVEAEPPDFILQDGSGALGIEFTEFHLPPAEGRRPHQERQSLKTRIVALAERIHHEAGGPALYVGVYFNERAPLSKSAIQPLAQAIAESVLSAPLPQSFAEPTELPWGQRPEATWGIQIHRSINGIDKLWHADAGGWVASVTAEHIRSVVTQKARMVPLARNRCEKLWLVVVNDAFSRAAPAEISMEALTASYEGPFDRLVWLLPHIPEARDLKITGPAA